MIGQHFADLHQTWSHERFVARGAGTSTILLGGQATQREFRAMANSIIDCADNPPEHIKIYHGERLWTGHI